MNRRSHAARTTRPAVKPKPLIDLSSGYVLRHRPAAAPGRRSRGSSVRTTRDLFSLRFGAVAGALEFAGRKNP
jgi:hypothetical protein